MCKQENQLPVNTKFKARIFEMIFHNKPELLDLYNAVNETDYKDPEMLEINTLKNAIYMSMHNDISFIIDCDLSLYEHQSTFTPNMPLRLLFYGSEVLSNLTRNANLYGSKKVQIPAPHYLVFYNGIEKRPEREELKLSDLFYTEEDDPKLELKVTLLNINKGYNEELKKKSKTLRDYVEYTDRVRRYANEMSIEEAVDRAVAECIKEGILTEFLSRNQAEAKKMSIYEYDEEKHMRMEREASFADGKQEGLEEGLEKGLE